MASTAVYQAQYYEKNKDKLREKAREREKNKRILAKAFVNASAKTNVELSSPSPTIESNQLQTAITAYVIPPLLLISTFLMIREMTNVYSEVWGTVGAILLALAIEGFTLLFSFAHTPTVSHKIAFRGLAVVLALGSIYGMSANHYATGLSSYRADQVTERAITDLETSIQRKQSQSDAFFAKGWIGSARRLERQIDNMRGDLARLRRGITQSKPATAVASTTLFEIFIRFVLTICNIVGAHLFGISLKRFENFKATSDIPRAETGIPRPDNLKFLRPQKQPQNVFQKGFLKAFNEALGYDSG